MKRAAAQNQKPETLQGEHSLSADNFCSPAFFCSKSAAPITYIEDNGAKRKSFLTGTISYIPTGREAEIAANVARILLRGGNHGA